MGLASKLAASQGGAPPPAAGGYGAPPPPQGQGQYGAPPPQTQQRPGGAPGGAPGGQYPGQGQYQAYSGAGGQQPPPQQGGYQQQQQPPYPNQPPPQQGGYGQQPPPAAAGPGQVAAYKAALQSCIAENQLQNFYPPNSPQLDQLAHKAAAQITGLCQRWRIPQEIGNDLVKLGLYDIVIFIDDSGSMQFEENGSRIDDLKLILERVASTATIFDEDGISLRFMNARYDTQYVENIKTEQQINQLIQTVQFKGLTPMGTELKNKVIDGIVLPKVRERRYPKPTLVIAITDGQPAGESPTAVFDTIKYAVQQVGQSYGPGGIAFQFAQVGNDTKAREFLSKLDEDPVVGKMVDCTSNFENESDEMRKKGVDLTPDLWLVKLLVGAIDRSYDSKDESAGAGAPPPPGHYGAPPAGQYGAPPGGQYGAPPGGQYGAPQGGQYGAPPQQGGYPPQQGGYPPQQGAGRGYPPPQGGQGGYGAPGGQTRY